MVSPRIFDKWFTLPNLLLLAPIPVITAALFVLCEVFLRRMHLDAAAGRAGDVERWCWAPFVCTVGIFILAFYGLAYSMFPYLVVDRMTIWQAASAPDSLKVILAGALAVLPAIIGYTIYSYRVFWGKARDLTYY